MIALVCDACEQTYATGNSIVILRADARLDGWRRVGRWVHDDYCPKCWETWRDTGLRQCGTVAAYRRHLRDGEPSCRKCRDANNLAAHMRRDS